MQSTGTVFGEGQRTLRQTRPEDNPGPCNAQAVAITFQPRMSPRGMFVHHALVAGI